MTKIRLARTGSTHQPHYRIVVSDSRNPRDGRFIEILGSYHPLQGGDVTVNVDRANYWLSVGAQPSTTVIGLLTKGGVKHNLSVRRKPAGTAKNPAAAPKPAPVAIAESEAEAAVEETTESVVEEAAQEVVTEAETETTAEAEDVVAEAPLSDQAAEVQSEEAA